jgi:hypothetical protein
MLFGQLQVDGNTQTKDSEQESVARDGNDQPLVDIMPRLENIPRLTFIPRLTKIKVIYISYFPINIFRKRKRHNGLLANQIKRQIRKI